MKKSFIIDGGAGRVISAIPALIKHVKNNPQQETRIFIGGWDTLLWGIPELHNISYSMDVKGNFEKEIMTSDVIISPEPYRLPSYFKQQKSLVQAFDEIINETNDHSDLQPPTLIFNKSEEKSAANLVGQVKAQQQKQITIVIQPFGRSANRVDDRDIIDDSSRSIESSAYLKLVKKLATKYNLIFFGEEQLYVPGDDFTFKTKADLRMWAAIIDASDYFIGCDSVGQHMARSRNIPGTVVIGSTFAINTTYPEYFNIFERPNTQKIYSPIRISGFESHLADRYNDLCMDYSDSDIDNLYKSIVSDIGKKVK
jgi:hypothetical protein